MSAWPVRAGQRPRVDGMMLGMHLDATAIAVMVVGMGVVVAAVLRRDRLHPRVRDGLYVFGGGALGLGALVVQSDVSTAEWVLTPLVMGSLALLHLRALFAGSGPFRT